MKFLYRIKNEDIRPDFPHSVLMMVEDFNVAETTYSKIDPVEWKEFACCEITEEEASGLGFYNATKDSEGKLYLIGGNQSAASGSTVDNHLTEEQISNYIAGQKIIRNKLSERYFELKLYQLSKRESEVEMATWNIQLEEAQSADRGDPNTPVLDAVAEAKGENRLTLARSILQNHLQYKRDVAEVIGKLKTLKSQIKQASTVDALNTIDYPFEFRAKYV